jgi:hypothetical protein
MPTCNLAETIHIKWLQYSGNKMICLYEATVDDMNRAFMQISNYRTWLKRGFDDKGHDSASLKLKATAICGDPKMLADAMKSYLGQKTSTLEIVHGRVKALWFHQTQTQPTIGC